MGSETPFKLQRRYNYMGLYWQGSVAESRGIFVFF